MSTRMMNSRSLWILIATVTVVLVILIATQVGSVSLYGSAIGGPTATPTPIPTDVPIFPPTQLISICHKLDVGYVEMQIDPATLPAHRAAGDLYPVPASGCPVPISPTGVLGQMTVTASCVNITTNGKPMTKALFVMKNVGPDMTTPGTYTLTNNGTVIRSGQFTFVSGQRANISPAGPGLAVLTITNVVDAPLTFTQPC
jgi:hypothetical protein